MMKDSDQLTPDHDEEQDDAVIGRALRGSSWVFAGLLCIGVMVWVIQPFYGITYSIRAFVIVTAAGLGNLPGVIAAGLGIGAAEQYGAQLFGIGYQQAIAVLLLLIVLLVRLIQQRRVRQVLK